METIEQLRRMAVFAKVVELGSFTQAAQHLGVGKSAISKHITKLENDLGLRLLNRSTRSLGLTDAGARFYAHCERMLEEAAQARDIARQLRDEASGTLRVATTQLFGRQVLIPVLAELAEEHPHLDAQVLLHDDTIDIVERGVDVALRFGFFKDSGLVQRRIARFTYGLFASPKYVKRHGRPKTPYEAAERDWAVFTFLRQPNVWTFRRPTRSADETATVEARTRIQTDSTVALMECVVQGLAVAPLLIELTGQDEDEKRLVRLMPKYTLDPEIGLFAVYPHRRHQPAKVRILVDAVTRAVERMGEGRRP